MTKQFALLRLSQALSRPRLALLAVALLGLLLRIAYAAAIYEPSLLAYGLDDYILYRVGAELIAQGDLSFSHDLFLLRPPLFPLLVAALNMNDFAVIAANILLGTSVIPFTYMLARMLRLSPQRSLLPAFLVALDPTSIKYAGVLLAEPLANVLLACAFVCVLATRDSQQGKTAILWAWLAGGCLILSAFARPAAYMLWLPMALWLLANIRSRGGGGVGILPLLALVSLPLLGIGLWLNHGLATFGHNTFSTVGNWNLLYVRAASVRHQATQQDIDAVYAELAQRVEARLGNDTAGITAARRHNHYTGSPELQNSLTAVALEVFLEHPLHYLLTMPVGAYRLLIKVSGGLFWLGVGWNVLLLALACGGLWRLVAARRWLDASFLLLPSAYFVFGTLLFFTSGIDTRARVMVTPLLAVMATYGALWWHERRPGKVRNSV